MSINKYKPHLLILPEDDANRQIANGFIQNINVNQLTIQVLPFADGWLKTVDKFVDDYASEMQKYPKRMMVLLIDLDKRKSRLTDVQEQKC